MIADFLRTLFFITAASCGIAYLLLSPFIEQLQQ
jgi:hypothetical protein